MMLLCLFCRRYFMLVRLWLFSLSLMVNVNMMHSQRKVHLNIIAKPSHIRPNEKIELKCVFPVPHAWINTTQQTEIAKYKIYLLKEEGKVSKKLLLGEPAIGDGKVELLISQIGGMVLVNATSKYGINEKYVQGWSMTVTLLPTAVPRFTNTNMCGELPGKYSCISNKELAVPQSLDLQRDCSRAKFTIHIKQLSMEVLKTGINYTLATGMTYEIVLNGNYCDIHSVRLYVTPRHDLERDTLLPPIYQSKDKDETCLKISNTYFIKIHIISELFLVIWRSDPIKETSSKQRYKLNFVDDPCHIGEPCKNDGKCSVLHNANNPSADLAVACQCADFYEGEKCDQLVKTTCWDSWCPFMAIVLVLTLAFVVVCNFLSSMAQLSDLVNEANVAVDNVEVPVDFHPGVEVDLGPFPSYGDPYTSDDDVSLLMYKTSNFITGDLEDPEPREGCNMFRPRRISYDRLSERVGSNITNQPNPMAAAPPHQMNNSDLADIVRNVIVQDEINRSKSLENFSFASVLRQGGPPVARESMQLAASSMIGFTDKHDGSSKKSGESTDTDMVCYSERWRRSGHKPINILKTFSVNVVSPKESPKQSNTDPII